MLAAYSAFASPSRAVAAREELTRIEAVFARLPDDDREGIVMAKLFGLSRAQVAQQLGRTEASAKGLLTRALSELAEPLDLDRC